MSGFGRDLGVTACGAVTSVLTAVLLAFIEWQFQFSLYTWTFCFFIPAGAIFSGFAAAGGYYLGAVWLGRRPSPGILINMLVVSVLTFFFIQWLGYTTLEVEGVRISERLDFGTYLDIMIRNQSINLRVGHGGTAVGSTGELGSWGYLYTLLQIVGFAIGGLAVYGFLSSVPYCEPCSRYFSKKGKQQRYWSDEVTFTEFAASLPGKEPQAAIDEHATLGAKEYKTGLMSHHSVLSTLDLRVCSKCGLHWLQHTVSRLGSNGWDVIHELTFARTHAQELELGR